MGIDNTQQIKIIKELAKAHFNKDFTDEDAANALSHINLLVNNGSPSTTETLVLGIKKKIFADILKRK